MKSYPQSRSGRGTMIRQYSIGQGTRIRRAMQYAKYHDRKIRSANRSPNARFENLIDEPCVKTYEGKCVNNAELFLRTRIARVNEMRCVQSDEWM